MGVAPTGRQVVYTGVNVDRVVNGRSVEHGGAANLPGLLPELVVVRVVARNRP